MTGVSEEDRIKVLIINDRTQAILRASKLAKNGDIILVAGKGHEDYQEIQGIRYPFSDAEWVLNALKKRAQA